MQTQNPFSLYDFLGYLIPGIIFLYTILHFTFFATIAENFFNIASIHDQFVFAHEIFIIALAYVFGHFLIFLSSMLVEKFAIYRYDYPSIFLLNDTEKTYFDLRFPWNLFGKFLLFVILLPVALADFVLIRCLRFTPVTPRRVHEQLKLFIVARLMTFFDNRTDSTQSYKLDGEMFRVIYHYCLENRINHVQKFQNYVALYGFSRTMCITFVIAFWLGILAFAMDMISAKSLILSLFFHTTLAATFYFGFLKFYRRFTLEVLMAFVSVSNKNHDNR